MMMMMIIFQTCSALLNSLVYSVIIWTSTDCICLGVTQSVGSISDLSVELLLFFVNSLAFVKFIACIKVQPFEETQNFVVTI